MTEFLQLTVVGIIIGSVYAVTASGLVVTYTTSGVFNFGHGALGMILAFTYWQIRVDWGVPTWLAVVLTVFVAAPLLGIALERILFRRLSDASTAVSLVVTIALLVILLGAGVSIWPPTQARTVGQFFAGETIEVLDIVISYHELITLAVAIGVAVGLRLLLFGTRLGVAMRAVVDNRELAAQNGVLPERVSAMAWAIGSMLAGAGGVLLASVLGLEHVFLTLLVINGYAAAILGKLRSLPLTFAGAMVLGLGESYLNGYSAKPWAQFGEGWIGNGNVLAELAPSFAVLFLFAVLVGFPQARLSAGRLVREATPRVPSLPASLRNAGVFVAVAIVASFVIPEDRLFDATEGLVLGMIMLSVVLLTGYGGQVALCQFAFVGIGALVMGKVAADGQLAGIVVSGLVAAAVGAVVAIPALRLQPLYLALVTFSVALFCEKVVFEHPRAFGSDGSIFFDGVALGPLDVTGRRASMLVAAVGFAVFAVAVLAIRRSAFGRRIAAMSDSPAASATLGMNILGTKIAVFATSAFLAGAAGGLYAATRGSAGKLDFTAIEGLLIFLLVTIGGLTSVSGAFIGGVVSAGLVIVQSEWLADTSLADLDLRGLFIGGGALLISRAPNGFAGLAFARADQRRAGRRAAEAPPGEASPERREGAVAVELTGV